MSDHWTGVVGIRQNKFLSTVQNELLKAVQGAFYAVLLWRLLYQNRDKLFSRRQGGEHRRLIRNWLLIFCSMFSLLAMMRIVYSWILLHAPAKSAFLAMTSPFHVIGSIGFFGLNVALSAFPGILYGLPVTPAPFRKKWPVAPMAEAGAISELEATESEETGAHYAQSFSADYLREIEAAIEACVLQERYLEENWTLARLTFQVNIPYHHLSYYFNCVKQEKFIEWRNRLKIEFACRLLQEGKSQDQTLEAIAAACGFGSKATFNRSFRQILGMTPSEYVENMKK